jgi:hypothetical protein
MKTNCNQTKRPVEIKARNLSRAKTGSGSVFSALLLAGALLFASGWGAMRCSAQNFPAAPTDGQTFSIGVVQIVVDPNFAFLFAPAPTYAYYYPGYAGPASGILTGPVMYDGNTIIGESAGHLRSATVFPIAAGTPNQYPPSTTYSNILGYGDFALIPPSFSGAPASYDQIFTQIKQMDLVGYVDTNGSPCSDPRVPSTSSSGTAGNGAGPQVTVKAGPGPFGIGPSLPMNRRSIGIVQQTTGSGDFPAQSFFDVFVEVTLPPVPYTISDSDFPAGGAVVYNDASDPLLIENLSLTELPPTVTYVHGQSTAVPIRFRDGNPPYWAAGDVLGYLTLAGHGVFTNTVTATAPCAAATAPGGLLDQTLGPVGSPNPPPPIPWLRPTNSFPTPNTSYGSVANTVVDPSSGTTNILDDTVSFAVPGSGILYFRDISLGNFQNPIPPPPYLGTSYYNPPSTVATMQVSADGLNWFPVAASGPASVTISNTTPVGIIPSTFNMEVLLLNLTGSSPFGTIMLRESPTKQSLGRHTIAPDPRGYRISSFFDVFTELSTDGGETWHPANRSIRVLASMPPAVPGSIFASPVGTNVVVQWQNNFTLQSTTDLGLPFTDVKGPVTSGSYTNPVTGGVKYFRLRN